MAYTQFLLDLENISLTNTFGELTSILSNNFGKIEESIQDLMNEFEIDPVSKKIGTDTPIQSINSINYIVSNGQILLLDSNSAQKGYFKINQDQKSEILINVLNITESITSLDAEFTGSTKVNTFETTGASNFGAEVKYNSSISASTETFSGELIRETVGASTYAVTDLVLTKTSRRYIYVTLLANDTDVYNSGFDPDIENIKIKVDFDTNNPPTNGQEFTIIFAGIKNGNTDVTPIWLSTGSPIMLIPSATISIQHNGAGVLDSDLIFESVAYKSNISLCKAVNLNKLIITAEKNMA